MSDETSAAVQILLVEDNPIDARAVQKALKTLTITHRVVVVADGDQAIGHLRNPAITLPDLILLDLNLPGRDGLDVLEAMQTDATLRRVPVLVVTTSANEADVSGAYDRGANAYLNKPIDLDGWKDLVSRIESFWFGAVRFPSK